MLPEPFIQARQAQWKTLTALLERSEANPSALTSADIQQLGQLYRATTSDLAVVQRDFPQHRLGVYLNQLVARAHAALYQSEPFSARRLVHFITTGFPSTYRALWRFTLIAALLLFVPGFLAGLSTLVAPASARWLLPAEAQRLVPMIEDKNLWTNIPVNERPYMSAFIMQNNIQVSFLAFGGGMLAGLFTVYVMIFNGLMLGAILGLTMHYGVGGDMWTFIIAHGVIELSVICMAGGAGLSLGWAIVHPGLMRRRDALAQAARQAVKLAIGCVPLLILAGTIEGFISPAENIPWYVKALVGLGSGVLLYAYFLGAGRQRKRLW